MLHAVSFGAEEIRCFTMLSESWGAAPGSYRIAPLAKQLRQLPRLQLGLRWSGGRGTALRWRICFASFGFAAGQICVGRDSLEIGFRKRSRMIGKFFP